MSSCQDNVRAEGYLVSPNRYERPKGQFLISVLICESELNKVALPREKSRLILVMFRHDVRSGTIEWSGTKVKERYLWTVDIP